MWVSVESISRGLFVKGASDDDLVPKHKSENKYRKK